MAQISPAIPTFWEAINQKSYPTPIIKECDKIVLSEPGWTEGKGFWEGETLPVYEDGKYYFVDGGIRKYIRHASGSGYLEHDPEYWSGFIAYKTVKVGNTLNIVPYFKPA